MQRSVYHARSFTLYSKNLLQLNQSEIDLAKDDMKASLNRIYDLQNQINLQKLDVSDEHSALLDTKVVQMYFKQLNNEMDIKALNFSLTEGLLQISSSLFTLTNLDPKNFDETAQDDVFYFLYNNFQDLALSLYRSASLFLTELLTLRTAGLTQGNNLVFYLSIACVVVSVLGLIPVVHIVNQTK